jgi:transcriptional regulator with XRE-family HTH domain
MAAGAPAYRAFVPGLAGSVNLGRWISRRRQDIGLSRDDLAEQMGWHRETQGRLERGKRGVERREMDTLARALRVTLEDLWTAGGARTGEGAPAPPAGEPTLRDVLDELRAVRATLEELVRRLPQSPPD